MVADPGLPGPEPALITPFAPHARLLEALVGEKDEGRGVASTVHRFQGAESDVVIFDAVDATRGRMPLHPWFADPVGSTGARLVNVAMSRARERLIIISPGAVRRAVAGRAQASRKELLKFLRAMTIFISSQTAARCCRQTGRRQDGVRQRINPGRTDAPEPRPVPGGETIKEDDVPSHQHQRRGVQRPPQSGRHPDAACRSRWRSSPRPAHQPGRGRRRRPGHLREDARPDPRHRARRSATRWTASRWCRPQKARSTRCTRSSSASASSPCSTTTAPCRPPIGRRSQPRSPSSPPRSPASSRRPSSTASTCSTGSATP